MTIKIDWLRGCATALVTPFHRDGSIDDDCFRSLVKRQIKGGVNLLVPCGTTGESVTMDEHERLNVIKMTVEAAKGTKAKVIAGTGSNNTSATIDFTRRAREAGADAALVVAPYYNKPTQEGMFAHFSEIARSVKGFPIMLYNVPSRTSSNISGATTLRLAGAHENIVATKEASGNFSQVMEIIIGRPKNFKLFSGDDTTALPLLAIGADGLVSVCANEIPKETSKMVEYALEGAYRFARKVHYKILPLMEANFIESSPAPCKFVMKEMGLLEENLRLPLVPVIEETRAKL
ncbi:MAG TPA: 4-hydroxy-tetrahydrodipicolinate synthase, partial [Pyrinomonadaceae bacterium]|nr:4-hydroxy-tetrahydrodipicolinate synthase [Pyrinomonadaceae bacterium]